MREIKFRFWDASANKYAADITIGDNSNTCYRWGAPSSRGARNIEVLYDAIIPEQFIGLRDFNGKEIYEGDLIECSPLPPFELSRSYEAAAVVYDEEHAAFGVWLDNNHGRAYFATLDDFEITIVGNIHNKV